MSSASGQGGHVQLLDCTSAKGLQLHVDVCRQGLKSIQSKTPVVTTCEPAEVEFDGTLILCHSIDNLDLPMLY